MADKQPTFRDRIERLTDAGKRLSEIVSIIADEVDHMTAAEARFAERRKPKAKADR